MLTLRESMAIIKANMATTADDTLREAVATLEEYFSHPSDLAYLTAQKEKSDLAYLKAMEEHI